MTELGKTLSVWSAMMAMPEADVLIICPKDGLPQRRRTFALAGPAGKNVTLTNYERTKALMAPLSASNRRLTQTGHNDRAKHSMLK